MITRKTKTNSKLLSSHHNTFYKKFISDQYNLSLDLVDIRENNLDSFSFDSDKPDKTKVKGYPAKDLRRFIKESKWYTKLQ